MAHGRAVVLLHALDLLHQFDVLHRGDRAHHVGLLLPKVGHGEREGEVGQSRIIAWVRTGVQVDIFAIINEIPGKNSRK